MTSDVSEHSASIEPARRFILAQSWWIASELVRRHPELMIFETHPGGGMYDVLQVGQIGKDTHLERAHAMLNRAGTVQVHFGSQHGRQDQVIATWREVLAAPNPHQIVKQIEHAAGWGSPDRAPATEPRGIAYRVIAGLLRMMVDDRHPWDARNEFVDSSGDDGGPRGYIERFAQLPVALRSATHLDVWGEPESHAWIILRAEEPVAAVTVEGQLYVERRREDLLSAYRVNGRRLNSTIVSLLGDIL